MSANERLTLAVQRKGRLNEGSIDLLQSCGLKLKPSKSTLFCTVDNFPLDILLVRDDDIPVLVKDGLCDLGIVGENVLNEQSNQPNQAAFNILRFLGFAQCRLSIACPKEINFTNINQLANSRIATSYPNILKNYLNTINVPAKIVPISGSVEIAPRLKMSEAICDLVSTGRTLAENDLKEILIVLQSQAVLVQAKRKLPPSKMTILEMLLNKIQDNAKGGMPNENCLLG